MSTVSCRVRPRRRTARRGVAGRVRPVVPVVGSSVVPTAAPGAALGVVCVLMAALALSRQSLDVLLTADEVIVLVLIAGLGIPLYLQGSPIEMYEDQVLVAVMRRKLGMPWNEVVEITAAVRSVCRVTTVTEEVHEKGVAIARRFRWSIYDGTIAASALLAGCSTLWTEDLQDGQVLERRLVVRNPFRGG